MEIASINNPRKEQLERYLAHTPRTAFRLFAVAAAGMMLWAWLVRDFRYVQAESGAGYALGIIGASMMMVLLLYPLRKRLRFMRSWLNLRSWFRLHMLLGVLGPSCILLHCNFRLGSTNSTVALIAMLLVAGSGLIGRYLYGKFHYGLYGQQVELAQIKEDLDTFYAQTNKQGLGDEEAQQLAALHGACGQVIDSQRQEVSLRQLIGQRKWLHQQKKQLLETGRGGAAGGVEEHYRALAGLLDKLAGLRLFERLFGLWHVVHIPVFLLMIITAVVHIFVVHWY